VADLLNFELVSPDRLLISQEVQQVVVPGSDGNFAVLPNHAPVLSTMRPGIIDITDANGNNDRYFVRGGFAEVNPTGLTVLAEEAIHMSELDKNAIDRQVQNTREDVEDAKTPDKRQQAREALDHLTELQAAF